jgi:hypothetical protein
VDFTTYQANYEVNNIITDIKNAGGHHVVDRGNYNHLFYKINAGNQIIFSNNTTTGVSYNKM